MNDKTTIMGPAVDKTQLLSNPKTHEKVQNLQAQAQSRYSILKGIAAGGIVLGTGAALSSFMPASVGEAGTTEELIPVYDEPSLATSVNDEMSYQQAFDAARTELGPGHYFTWHGQNFSTYTQEEWQRLDAEDQEGYEQFLVEHSPEVPVIAEYENNAPAVIHDVAPAAHTVRDDMSFSQAFATARQEVGAGGVFHWRGQCYGTYYQSEWQSMDADARHSFAQSHAHIASPQGGSTAEPITIPEETLLEEEVGIIAGQPVRIAAYQNGHGELTLRVDANLDGSYDYIYLRESNQLVSIEDNVLIDLDNLDEPGGDIASVLYTQEGNIEGFPALAHVMSNGSVQILVDTDLSGSYDTHLSHSQEAGGIIAVNLQGEVEVFKTSVGGSVSVSLEEEIVVIGEDDIIADTVDVVILEEETIVYDVCEDVLIDPQPANNNWVNTVAIEDNPYEPGPELAHYDLHQEFGDDVILGDDASDWA